MSDEPEAAPGTTAEAALDYKVELPEFEGPLDLLLHLVLNCVFELQYGQFMSQENVDLFQPLRRGQTFQYFLMLDDRQIERRPDHVG